MAAATSRAAIAATEKQKQLENQPAPATAQFAAAARDEVATHLTANAAAVAGTNSISKRRNLFHLRRCNHHLQPSLTSNLDRATQKMLLNIM
jgi:hypothetical protein